MNNLEILETMKSVVQAEKDALETLLTQMNDSYVEAVRLILASKGKVVVTGIGKSGQIAQKVSATLISVGTVSVFLHPVEALHGDLGIVTADDVVIAFGKSGESDELLALVPFLRRIGTKIIAVTAKKDSSLAKNADVVLFSEVLKEAPPLDLVPTASTSVAMAIGDALALTVMKAKGFKQDDFAFYHPGGALGRRLQLKLKDILIPKEQCPVLSTKNITLDQIVLALGKYSLGIVLFSNDGNTLDGIITDGDIRRLLDQHKDQIFQIKIEEKINRSPLAIQENCSAAEALSFMEGREKPLNVVPVLRGKEIVGIIRLHEMLK